MNEFDGPSEPSSGIVSGPSSSVTTVEVAGTAQSIHDRDPFESPRPADGSGRAGGLGQIGRNGAVWRCLPTARALVLGSRQVDSIVDRHALATSGAEFARRRSGGGAVLVDPHDVAWIDLIVPHGRFPNDVRASMVAAGTIWADALAAIGAVARDALSVHDGAMRTTAWSELICFCGVGPGEVLRGGRKLVGLSQRRTRDGLRIQGQVHRRPLVLATRSLIRREVRPDGVDDPPEADAIAGLDVEALVRALALGLAR